MPRARTAALRTAGCMPPLVSCRFTADGVLQYEPRRCIAAVRKLINLDTLAVPWPSDSGGKLIGPDD